MTSSVCMMCGVARLNIYLPDDLAAQAKRADLNVSALAREAIRRRLLQDSTDSWLSSLPVASGAVTHDRAMKALDDAREEPPTRHG